jgi:hypothetical protein
MIELALDFTQQQLADDSGGDAPGQHAQIGDEAQQRRIGLMVRQQHDPAETRNELYLVVAILAAPMRATLRKVRMKAETLELPEGKILPRRRAENNGPIVSCQSSPPMVAASLEPQGRIVHGGERVQIGVCCHG